MATAQTLIDRALRLNGVIASGQSPTATETADALIALNAMLESWQTDKLNVYAFVDTAIALTAADASYTVGPSGDFNLTPRPSKIEQCFIRISNFDYPVKLVESEEWFAIVDKTTTTSDIPTKAYYEPSLPTGTLLLWPVPNTANSLHIVTWTSLVTLASAATAIALPAGYERAIVYNLAVETAPEFGAHVTREIAKIAAESYAAIKRMNHRPIMTHSALAPIFHQRRTNIETGC